MERNKTKGRMYQRSRFIHFISLVALQKQTIPHNILVLYLGQLLPGVKLALEVLCDSKVVSVVCLLPVALYKRFRAKVNMSVRIKLCVFCSYTPNRCLPLPKSSWTLSRGWVMMFMADGMLESRFWWQGMKGDKSSKH